MNNPNAILMGSHGHPVPLQDVAVSAVLQDLLAEVSVSQTYRNAEPRNIEAVYTFPLPLGAVLLGLEVTLGARVLRGVVVEKHAAEEAYEDALEAGDSAVMLETPEPGIYTVNLGNLLAQETAKITFRYAMLHRWVGDRLRIFLPTTIAPRYGGWQHSPHQAPRHSLTVENQFSLCVEVFGALRDAGFACPSHAVSLTRTPEKTVLALQQPQAVMDRDFVLNIRAPQAPRSAVLCGQDGEGSTAIASFQPFFPGLHQPRPLALAIVIDCSGSMQGDSITQAKDALDRILASLQPQDRVTIVAFGSTTAVLSTKLLPCNPKNLARARRFGQKLQADMGGTEIGAALCAAYAAIGNAGSGDVFLLTDGQVGHWERVKDEASAAGHRVFTVGVGSAVSEAFLQGLSAETGGHCELVSPREDMADRVVRHFDRMRAPRAKHVAVIWPEGASSLCPSKFSAVFEGDTVLASAVFAARPAGGVAVLEVHTEDGAIARQEVPLPPTAPASTADGLSTVARVAAAARLQSAEPAEGLHTALRYQLMSPWTNCLVIAERAEEEKPSTAPELRQVPQTLAAGWGGTGTFDMARSAPPSQGGGVMRRAAVGDAASVSFMRSADSVEFVSVYRSEYHLPEMRSSFGRRDHDAHEGAGTLRRPLSPALPDPYRRLLELIDADPSRLSVAGALGLLTESGLRVPFDDVLQLAQDVGVDVDMIAAIILGRLMGGELGECLTARCRDAAGQPLWWPAQDALYALRELVRPSRSLARAMRASSSHALLFHGNDAACLARFTRLDELLRTLDARVRPERDRLDKLLEEVFDEEEDEQDEEEDFEAG